MAIQMTYRMNRMTFEGPTGSATVKHEHGLWVVASASFVTVSDLNAHLSACIGADVDVMSYIPAVPAGWSRTEDRPEHHNSPLCWSFTRNGVTIYAYGEDEWNVDDASGSPICGTDDEGLPTLAAAVAAVDAA